MEVCYGVCYNGDGERSECMFTDLVHYTVGSVLSIFAVVELFSCYSRPVMPSESDPELCPSSPEDE